MIFGERHTSNHGVQALTGQELTNRTMRLRALLTNKFSPAELEIVDESSLHHGHAGAAPGGETHYRIRIRAPAFAGLSRVARHRLVNNALSDEFDTGLHALSVDADSAL
jgi:BolA protein